MYKYKYCIYTNNARDGVRFVAAFDTLQQAQREKDRKQATGGGCCDILKKRFSPYSKKPLHGYSGTECRYYYDFTHKERGTWTPTI